MQRQDFIKNAGTSICCPECRGCLREQGVVMCSQTALGAGFAVRDAKAVLKQRLCISGLAWACSVLGQAAATSTALSFCQAWPGATDTPPQTLTLQCAAGFISTSWDAVLLDAWLQKCRRGCMMLRLSAAKA